MKRNWFARVMGWALRLTAVDDGDPAGGDPAGGDPAKPAAGDPAKPAAGDPAKPAAGDPAKPAGGDPAKPGEGDPWLGLRETYAGDDAKKLAKLNRYATPAAALDAFLSLQDRLRSGELKAPLPKDATEDQVKAWRAENGIPEAPDKYELTMRDGVKVTAEDKPYVDAMLAAVHAKGANNEIASTVVDLYYTLQQQMTDARATKDAEFKTQSEDALRVEWGKDFRPNMNMVTGLVATMPADVADIFMHGRLANGDPIMSHPGVLKALNDWSRQINPVSTLVPAGEGDISGAIETEIKQIEGWMRAGRGTPEGKKYWDDEKVQERYRALLDGRDRAKQK